MRSIADRREKARRVSLIRGSRGGSLVLQSHEAVSWYLEGVRTHVSLAGPPVIAVRVDDDGDTLFIADNEVDRLIAEELLPMDAERIVRVPWWIAPAEAASQQPALTERDVAIELRAARAQLLPAERGRYRELGRDVARALTDVLARVNARSIEVDVAGMVSGRLAARGIDPLVVLVSGETRATFRHPLPSGEELGDRAMIVVCGRRDGLIANATRWVGRSVDDEAIWGVERAFLDASHPGARLDEAFTRGAAAYAEFGFAPDEWRRHHQGGPTGYAGRDPRATTSTKDVLTRSQAFAWNPTAAGAKVEDTMIGGEDGWEVLTVDDRWPTTEYQGMLRPLTLAYCEPPSRL